MQVTLGRRPVTNALNTRTELFRSRRHERGAFMPAWMGGVLLATASVLIAVGMLIN